MKLSQMEIKDKVYGIKSNGETDGWQVFDDPAATKVVSLSSPIESWVANLEAKLFPADQADREKMCTSLTNGITVSKNLIGRYDWDDSLHRYGKSETDLQKARVLTEEKRQWRANIEKGIKRMEAEMERLQQRMSWGIQ